MKHILHNDYAIQIVGERFQNGHVYFYDDHHHYVTMPVDNKEDIYMEQAALAHYLVDNGFYQTTLPIPNIYGDWFFQDEGQRLLVLKIIQFQTPARQAHGKQLARFHQLNKSYPYKPKYISSYGAWHELWINKLTMFEREILEHDITNDNHHFYQLLRDILPYIVGISENAIQYVRETGEKSRFNENDQGTITFQRYQSQTMASTISLSDLVYDHGTRDLAEYIRQAFLKREKDSFQKVERFISDYESVQPLSAFSWQLLYARLTFPIHFFDLIAMRFETEGLAEHYQNLEELIDKQSLYEKRLRGLYDLINSDSRLGHLPQLQWL